MAHHWMGRAVLPGDQRLGLTGRQAVERGDVGPWWLPLPVGWIPYILRRALNLDLRMRINGDAHDWTVRDAWFTAVPHVIDGFDGTPRLFEQIGKPHQNNGAPVATSVLARATDADTATAKTVPQLFADRTLVKRQRAKHEQTLAQKIAQTGILDGPDMDEL
jgi:hypothetical protein